MDTRPLILQPHHPWIGPWSERDQLYAIEREEIQRAGYELTIVDEDPGKTSPEMIRSAVAVLRRGWAFPREMLEKMEACRVIVSPGIGLDGIDLAAAAELGIVVTNVPHATAGEVADHAIALLLACARKFVPLDRAMRQGSYDWRKALPIYSLRGKTAGLIAFGATARSAAGKLQAFGMKVIAYDPYASEATASEMGVRLTGLNDLLQQADFVSVHAPLTPETHHLIGEAELRLMKPTAFFVQVSRGGVVDQMALAKALEEGRLAGAGLDVQEKEPPDPDHPLLRLDNVILTPHYAGYSEEGFREQKRLACEAIVQVINGRWPRWVVNPQVKPKLPLEKTNDA